MSLSKTTELNGNNLLCWVVHEVVDGIETFLAGAGITLLRAAGGWAQLGGGVGDFVAYAFAATLESVEKTWERRIC